jgi:hypothetical protein
MRRILLHVGMHKTGTTSLQSLLHHNYSVLRQHDVLVPLVYANHSSLLVPAFKQRLAVYDHAVELARSRCDHALGELKRFSRRALSELLSASWSGHLVIVAEDVSSHLDDDEKQLLLQTLSSYSDHLHVIGFVREPKGFIASMIVQLLRNRYSYSQIVSDPDHWVAVLPQYRQRFEFLIRFCQPGYSFELFPYHPPIDPANPLARTLACLGLDAVTLSADGLSANSALPACGQHYLNFLNTLCPSHDVHRPHPGWRKDAVEVAEQLVSHVDFESIIDEVDLDRLAAKSFLDYQWVCEQITD